MRIDAFAVDYRADHDYRREMTRTTRTDALPVATAVTSPPRMATAVPAPPARIGTGQPAAVPPDEPAPLDLPPLFNLIKAILERVLNTRVTLFDPRQLARAPDDLPAQPVAAGSTGQAAARPAAGTVTTTRTTVTEQESLQFSASGQISTADGRQFSFSLSVAMQRSVSFSSSETIRQGGNATDPLMIVLGNDAGALSGASVRFDLHHDGSQVALPFAANGGWLALDRDGNGTIDNGSELFGPQSGNGFADLATLDDNHDGVIDQADPAYARLQVWTGVDANGRQQTRSLAALQIGAILLPSAETPFTLGDDRQRDIGRLRRSGIYLTEDGHAGRISQIDLLE